MFRVLSNPLVGESVDRQKERPPGLSADSDGELQMSSATRRQRILRGASARPSSMLSAGRRVTGTFFLPRRSNEVLDSDHSVRV